MDGDTYINDQLLREDESLTIKIPGIRPHEIIVSNTKYFGGKTMVRERVKFGRRWWTRPLSTDVGQNPLTFGIPFFGRTKVERVSRSKEG